MTKLLRQLVCATALCLASLTVHGQVPSGTIFMEFEAPEAAIWDFSGNYDFTQPMIGAGGEPVDLSFSSPLVHTSYGKLTNGGMTMLFIGSDVVAAQYSLKGRAFGGWQKGPQVKLTATFSGEDVIGGQQRSFSGKLNYNLFVDPETLELYGTVKGNLSIRGVGKVQVNDFYAMPLPANMTGAWQLRLDVSPLTKLVGTAQATLSNGRVIPFTISGKYSAKDNTSTLSGKSIDPEKGSNFKIRFSMEDPVPFYMKGTILGQKLW